MKCTLKKTKTVLEMIQSKKMANIIHTCDYSSIISHANTRHKPLHGEN